MNKSISEKLNEIDNERLKENARQLKEIAQKIKENEN